MTSSKISEIRKKKHMTNNVKTAPNPRSLETLRRKFSRRISRTKTSIVTPKSLRAKRMVSKTKRHSKKLTKLTLKSLTLKKRSIKKN